MKRSKISAVLITVLPLVVICAVVNSVALMQRSNSANQNGNSSQPTSSSKPTPDFSKNTWDLPADAADTRNPVSANEESVAQGKEIFMTPKGNCVFCHGDTGAGNEANFPKLRRRPADLSNKAWMSKLSDGEIYWKITKGIPGIMPGHDDPKLTAQERWQLVNFVRTLAKEKPKS